MFFEDPTAFLFLPLKVIGFSIYMCFYRNSFAISNYEMPMMTDYLREAWKQIYLLHVEEKYFD